MPVREVLAGVWCAVLIITINKTLTTSAQTSQGYLVFGIVPNSLPPPALTRSVLLLCTDIWYSSNTFFCGDFFVLPLSMVQGRSRTRWGISLIWRGWTSATMTCGVSTVQLVHWWWFSVAYIMDIVVSCHVVSMSCRVCPIVRRVVSCVISCVVSCRMLLYVVLCRVGSSRAVVASCRLV